MEKTIITLSVVTIILFLLFAAAVLFIIKILKTQSNYAFNFKRDSRLYSLAYKDNLTGLFNRNAYIRDLRKLERKKTEKFMVFNF